MARCQRAQERLAASQWLRENGGSAVVTGVTREKPMIDRIVAGIMALLTGDVGPALQPIAPKRSRIQSRAYGSSSFC
jgi:hypothetical protein